MRGALPHGLTCALRDSQEAGRPQATLDASQFLAFIAQRIFRPVSQVGFWGEDGGLAWEAWAASKADEAGFSKRVLRDQNGVLVSD